MRRIRSTSCTRPSLRAGLALAALSGLTAPGLAQNARAPIDLQPGINGVGSLLAIDSDADLTAAVWVDEVQLEVYCAVSDGRGVEWEPAVRVDTPPHSGSTFPLTFIHSSAVHVVGESIYVTWRELDLSTNNGRVFFARSIDGGASFSTELQLDDGVTGLAKSPRSITAVSPDPAGDHVYVLRLDTDASFGVVPPRVVASHDGGATFGAAVPITTLPATGFSSKDPNIWADGFEVHVVWAEDTNNPDAFEVYYQRSTDGGLTWLDFDVLLSRGIDQLPDLPEVRFAARGDTFLVSYVATSTVTGSDELRFNRSFDRGVNWLGSGIVASPVSGTDIRGPGLHVTRSGTFVAAWEDDSSGIPEVYTSFLTSTGSSFSGPDSIWSDSGLGGASAQFASPDDPGKADTLLLAFDAGGGITSGTGGTAPAFLSFDGGETFSEPVDLENAGDADPDYVELAYDETYDNYLAVWRAEGLGVEAVRTGGLRPQTLDAVGVVSGGSGQFDFSGFDPGGGGAKFVWALAADAPGNFPLPLGDGRDLGLQFDTTLQATLSAPTLFSALLDANGEGSTPPIGIAAPPGTQFYTAAVAIQLGPVALAEVTDVVPITVQ